MSKLEQTGDTRTIDSTGRLSVPSKLRDKYGLAPNTKTEIYIYTHDDGRKFICLECPRNEMEVEEAKRILQSLGYKI